MKTPERRPFIALESLDVNNQILIGPPVKTWQALESAEVDLDLKTRLKF